MVNTRTLLSCYDQLAPVTFSIAKKLGCTNRGGVLAACFVIFDMLNTTESRLVLMDAQVGSCPHRCSSMPCHVKRN